VGKIIGNTAGGTIETILIFASLAGMPEDFTIRHIRPRTMGKNSSPAV
jgi:hypothetical protein